METITVFGSTGYIGSRFCDRYKTYPQERTNNNPATDNVLYFISTTDNYNVFEDPLLDIETNLIKLMKVLQNCKDRKNLVFNFISSWFVYGDTMLPAKEDSICNPKGFYSITKKTAEDLLISFCKTFNINYRILRLANIIGRYDAGAGKKKNALDYIVRQIIANKPVDLYYGGEFTRDYMPIDECIRAIYTVMEKGKLNEVYNIGSGVNYVFKRLVDFAVGYIKSTSVITPCSPTEFHKLVQVKDMCLDVSKLRSLGFEQESTAYDAIIEIIKLNQ